MLLQINCICRKNGGKSMIVLLFVICIILTVAVCKSDGDELAAAFATILIIADFFLFGWICLLVWQIGELPRIDEKIGIYEQERSSIEKQVEIVVKDIYNGEVANITTEEVMTFALYTPELQEDELLQAKIMRYEHINYKIRELEFKKIKYYNAKWKLYFGR